MIIRPLESKALNFTHWWLKEGEDADKIHVKGLFLNVLARFPRDKNAIVYNVCKARKFAHFRLQFYINKRDLKLSQEFLKLFLAQNPTIYLVRKEY